MNLYDVEKGDKVLVGGPTNKSVHDVVIVTKEQIFVDCGQSVIGFWKNNGYQVENGSESWFNRCSIETLPQ